MYIWEEWIYFRSNLTLSDWLFNKLYEWSSNEIHVSIRFCARCFLRSSSFTISSYSVMFIYSFTLKLWKWLINCADIVWISVLIMVEDIHLHLVLWYSFKGGMGFNGSCICEIQQLFFKKKLSKKYESCFQLALWNIDYKYMLKILDHLCSVWIDICSLKVSIYYFDNSTFHGWLP